MTEQNQTETTNICPYCGMNVRSDRFEKHTSSKCDKRPKPHPFADILPRQEIPNWLLNIVESKQLPKQFPLSDILKDSCYYPASGFDASPIIIANGFVHSFIYSDYGIKREEYKNKLYFKGYTKILQRAVEKHEIVPSNWTPEMPRYFDEYNGFNRLMEAQKGCEPFGDWTIWERTEKYTDEFGPKNFSLFFLAGEGLATYQGLYPQNSTTPKVIAIIQPGHAFGGNWTNFTNKNAPFWQTIQKQETPDFLLIGSYGVHNAQTQCPFDGYKHLKTTKTYEPDRTEYTYNNFGQTTESLILALKLAEETVYEVRSRQIKGMTHTIDIYAKQPD